MAKRSVASATISFGLVAIPVKLYITASPENISFNYITKDGHRVKQVLVDAFTGEEVERASLQRGYEYAKGQYVVFTQEELKSLDADDDGGSMEIKEFIPRGSFDTLQVEKSYYLDSGKGGDKAYRMFAEALMRSEKLAVAQWTSRGRQHLIIIEPQRGFLIAHQMYYADEVREFDLDCATYTPKEIEIDMACKLIDALSSASFESEKYTNAYTKRVMDAVEVKKNGKTYEHTPEEKHTSTSDLFAALQASLKVNAA